jgi:mono/diheme cytochrome c family protein
MLKRLMAGYAFLLFVVVARGATPGAQAPPEGTPPLLTPSLAGKDSFDLYCAPCHGATARGDGPVAAALKARPPNLTELSGRNKGVYPKERVRDFVTGAGRTPAAHGTTEMPIWGPLFRAFESDTRARVRVENLVAYLETIQVAPTGPTSAGAGLFRTYCASCHGSDARGGGALADQMRKIPPDLTTFAARNGGVFPSERVRRIIDGRDVASHGDREMPVWGDAFTRTRGGLGEAAVKERIDAIVRYLDAIQERATR